MSVSIRKLNPGQEVVMVFHGSSQYGNSGYKEEGYFLGLHVNGDRAFFGSSEQMDDNSFEVYFDSNRWRYGSSAEVFTVEQLV